MGLLPEAETVEFANLTVGGREKKSAGLLELLGDGDAALSKLR